MFYWFVNYLHEIVLHVNTHRDRCRRRLLIPRGVHFSANIIPEIEVPRGHAAPYCNPRSGVEAPFFTMGPFASTDTLFPGAHLGI